MALDLIPVATKKRHFGENNPGVEIIGILFGKAQVLTVCGRAVTALHLQLRHFQAGFSVTTVKTEHITQLNDGAIDIPLCNQGEGILVMLLGAFLHGVAGRKC